MKILLDLLALSLFILVYVLAALALLSVWGTL